MADSPKSPRLFALDIFRGLTIIFMIMVNSPNTWGQFSHAYWDGIMFADVVFPFFIIIVGVAISLGLKNFQPGIDDPAPVMRKVIKRSITLFLLGMGVNLIYLHFSDVRILGVLQRIAIVYLLCSLLCLYCSVSLLFSFSTGQNWRIYSADLLVVCTVCTGSRHGSGTTATRRKHH